MNGSASGNAGHLCGDGNKLLKYSENIGSGTQCKIDLCFVNEEIKVSERIRRKR